MKKILLCMILVVSVFLTVSCGEDQNKNNDYTPKVNSLFDDDVTTVGNTDTKGTTPDVPEEENTSDDTPQTKDEENNEEQPEKQEETAQKPEYVFSEQEEHDIISKYIDAEDLYYQILYQYFDIDYNDTVTKNTDGYSAVYNRVLLFEINSIEELKALYRPYFTESFISSLDMSIYTEENGKLYCTATENTNSAVGLKHTYTVEGFDATNANVVRKNTDGSGVQRIPAVKIAGNWFYDAVALN